MNDLNAKPVSRTAKKAGPKKATTRTHSKLGNVNVPGGGDTGETDANITWAYTKQVKEDGEVANPMGFDEPFEEGKVSEAPQRTKSDTKHIENDSKFDYDDYPEIKIHGWMYKGARFREEGRFRGMPMARFGGAGREGCSHFGIYRRAERTRIGG